MWSYSFNPSPDCTYAVDMHASPASCKTITLPYPPSANRYWRNVDGKTLKSAEARAYQTSAGWSAKLQGVACLLGDVEVEIRVYRPAQRGDLDNCLKIILDALKGICYEDDKQIVKITAERFDDKDNPRVEIAITERGTT